MPKEFPKPEDYSAFSKLLGLSYPVYEDGVCRASLEIDDRLINNYGTAHGGVIYSIADVAMGAALWSILDEDEICKTVEVKISYLKPAFPGTLTCEAQAIGRTRKIGTAESEVICDGQVVAKTKGKFHISKV